MSNLERGEVEITIGGKSRVMRLGFDQVATIEQRLEGRSVLKLMSEGNFGMWALRESLYVGLLAHSPKITPEKISGWLEKDMGNLGYYIKKVAQAIAAFMPAAKKTDADDDEDGEGEAPLEAALPPPPPVTHEG